MPGLSLHFDNKPRQPDDGIHNANLFFLLLQNGPLLTVYFQKCFDRIFFPGYPLKISAQPVFLHGLAHCFFVFYTDKFIELFFSINPGYKLASQKRFSKPCAFLPNHTQNLEGVAQRHAALSDQSGRFSGAYDSRNPVKGPRASDRIQMGTGENFRQSRLRSRQSADDISHSVFVDRQAAVLHHSFYVSRPLLICCRVALACGTAPAWLRNAL